VKAAYIEEAGGPEKIKVGDLPTPEPTPDQVLIRNHAAGIAPADWKMMAGAYRPLTFPHIPGFETAGIVERAPAGSDLSPGDAVFGATTGGFAEFVVADAGRIARKPESLSFEEAAGLVIGPVTAYEALIDRMKIQPGETVLIDGASGGVGNAAVQIAVAAGARVYGVSSARNHQFVKDLGATEVFDYNQPGWSEAVRAAIPGGVDVLLDAVGGDSAVEAFKALKDGGRAALVASQAPDDIEERGIHAEMFAATTNRERLDALAKLVDEGKLRVEIQEASPLSDAREALEKVKTGHTRGKIVLKTS
jgi:NADPH:quinone reductase-like Zn-dependent oxidoreductase